MRKNNLLRGLLFVSGILLSYFANAQTNPTAQSLPYSQNFGTTTFSTMPTGMASWGGLNGASITTQTLAEGSEPTDTATVTDQATITTTA